ncbi:Cas4-domain exonuclease [Orpheovirus IHUMI-LCC2]|uniref:YqaJ-like viral recombinase domain protein n=1 Tax=Orpheovirus IHUMI-LCC2 TaxID=2023057 RepID=A0A2I2L6F4_9VIRU|nr:Cas4-domain exonuclease [Orpheovirus IHUMI-LCC2]SNW63049.1 YqaJ-like viral recombinase domain protein [Orpheovirus IHUMI-LCC2]
MSKLLNKAEKCGFPKDEFVDCGEYYLSVHDQLTDEWKDLRESDSDGETIPVLTGSKHSEAIGKSRFRTPEGLALELLGLECREYTEQNLENMKQGVEHEDIIAEKYCKTYQAKVEKIGLVIPKFDTRIGGSIDRVVVEKNGEKRDDLIAEIKCTKYMYPALKKRRDLKRKGHVFDKYDHAHIWDNHYVQMQSYMKILGKKNCDYVVYGRDDHDLYCETIPFNEDYWRLVIKPGLDKFFVLLNEVYERSYD